MIHTPGLKALHKTVLKEHINPSLFTGDKKEKKTIWRDGRKKKKKLPTSLAQTQTHTCAHTVQTQRRHGDKSPGTAAFKTECHISM